VLTIWDNRTYDGGIVSLFLDDKCILKKYEISKKRLNIKLQLDDKKEHQLTLYAHNLGKIPPNTVAIYIADSKKKKLITLSSDLKACSSEKIIIQ